MASLLARVLIVALALAAVGVLWSVRQDAVACQDARTAVFGGVVRDTVRAADVKQVGERCRDPEQVAITAAGLARTRLPEAARLTARARRDGPEIFAPQAAATLVAVGQRDMVAARRHWRRAKALNPRWVAPEPDLPRGAAP